MASFRITITDLLFFREERCNELAGRLKSTQDDIHRLESERAQLVAEVKNVLLIFISEIIHC